MVMLSYMYIPYFLYKIGSKSTRWHGKIQNCFFMKVWRSTYVCLKSIWDLTWVVILYKPLSIEFKNMLIKRAPDIFLNKLDSFYHIIIIKETIYTIINMSILWLHFTTHCIKRITSFLTLYIITLVWSRLS